MERRTASGSLSKPAHFGTCYRASNATYLGRSGARLLHIAPDGSVVSPRAVSKIRNDETGRDYAERMLVNTGDAARAPFEDPRAWLSRVMPTLQRCAHPGNLAYRLDVPGR